MTLNKQQVHEVLDVYIRAWQTQDPALIVTIFTAGANVTLPIWIHGELHLGQQLPEVNVVVFFVIIVTIIPVAVATKLAGAGFVSRAPVAEPVP